MAWETPRPFLQKNASAAKERNYFTRSGFREEESRGNLAGMRGRAHDHTGFVSFCSNFMIMYCSE
jgi:hypothetical protein